MSKTPFKLRSGNTTPFKEMGAMDSVVQNEIGSEIERVKKTDENFASESSETSINDPSKQGNQELLLNAKNQPQSVNQQNVNQGDILEDPSLQNA